MLSAVERGWNCLLVYLWEAAAILGGENMEKMKSFLRPSPEDAGAVLLLQPAELRATGEPNSDQQGGIAWLIGSDRNLGRKQPHTKDNYKKDLGEKYKWDREQWYPSLRNYGKLIEH
nr:uncharacterized protein LOC105734687 isoform X3 [Aotus nancymaae]